VKRRNKGCFRTCSNCPVLAVDDGKAGERTGVRTGGLCGCAGLTGTLSWDCCSKLAYVDMTYDVIRLAAMLAASASMNDSLCNGMNSILY